MGLTLKRGRDGEIRRWWYLEFYRPDGTRTVVNLNVPVEGNPPASGRVTEKGDALFERSRQRAQAAAEVLKMEVKQGRRDRSSALRLFKEHTGSKLAVAPTSALRNAFDGESRKRSKCWSFFCQQSTARITDWLKAQKVTTVLDVTVAHAKAFMNELYNPQKPLYTARTVKKICGVVAMAFDRLLPEGAPNPFRHPTLRILGG